MFHNKNSIQLQETTSLKKRLTNAMIISNLIHSMQILKKIILTKIQIIKKG